MNSQGFERKLDQQNVNVNFSVNAQYEDEAVDRTHEDI